jgi:hypothetical protein
MSRSYKHTPISKDNLFGRKNYKRWANKMVRRTMKHMDDDTSYIDHKGYRKLYDSWSIYDYKIRGLKRTRELFSKEFHMWHGDYPPHAISGRWWNWKRWMRRFVWK